MAEPPPSSPASPSASASASSAAAAPGAPPPAAPAGRSEVHEVSTIPARWGFWKGLLTGAALEVPAIAGTVWVLSQLGIGNPAAGFMAIIRLTTVFVGIAALFTAGGIGRLAAHAAATGGRARAMLVAARAHAVASAGLVFIATIPHGLPADLVHWIPIPLAGLVTGALCGALLGAVCGGAAPVGLAEVWWLATRPGEALTRLLAPEDIVKLGAALRARTTHLFEGIFDPAPPATPGPPPPADATPPPASATPPPASATPPPAKVE